MGWQQQRSTTQKNHRQLEDEWSDEEAVQAPTDAPREATTTERFLVADTGDVQTEVKIRCKLSLPAVAENV